MQKLELCFRKIEIPMLIYVEVHVKIINLKVLHVGVQ